MSQSSHWGVFDKCCLSLTWGDADVACVWRRTDILLFVEFSFDSVFLSCHSLAMRWKCKKNLEKPLYLGTHYNNSKQFPIMNRLIICSWPHNGGLLSQRRECCQNKSVVAFYLWVFLLNFLWVCLFCCCVVLSFWGFFLIWKDFCS